MGNILIVNDEPRIADFEYAERVDDRSRVHPARTVSHNTAREQNYMQTSLRALRVSCRSKSTLALTSFCLFVLAP